jgi:hypothetical protein
MKKPALAVVIALVLAVVVGIVMVVNKKKSNTPAPTDNTVVDLPINTTPVSDRPFITLSPDSTGRSLDIQLSGAPTEGELEYEMIYNASGKQEGALGSIFLSSEKQPIIKSILLGSKSGGGKITYHEGVTGGSITVTYAETRLKESWNYLHFDMDDPSFSATDGRFNVELTKTALKDDSVIITMKTFGYEKTGLPDGAKVIAGPYGYFTQIPIKGTASVELKLPAGEHVNPTLYEWDGTTWEKLATKLDGDTVSVTSTANVFVVIAE